MGRVDTRNVSVVGTITKLPLNLWALHNDEKVYEKFNGMMIYGVSLYDGFAPSIPGTELTDITQSYNLSTTRFIFKITRSHPNLFVVRTDKADNQKKLEILFDPFSSREEFEKQYLVTHLEEWPFVGKSDLEIYEAYISQELRSLV